MFSCGYASSVVCQQQRGYRLRVDGRVPGPQLGTRSSPIQAASAVTGKARSEALLPKKRDVAAAVVPANNGGGGMEGVGEEVGARKPSTPCQHPGCFASACYGHPGEQVTYCKMHAIMVGQEHSLEGMEGVRSKWCKHPGCKILASYSQPGQPAMLCKMHALAGMEAVRKARAQELEVGLALSLESMEDVRNKTCKHLGCKTRASYSRPGQPAMLCRVHALVGMEV